MRAFVSSLLLLCILSVPGSGQVAAGQVSEAIRASRPIKHEGMGLPLVRGASPLQGEDFTNPIPIAALPYNNLGSNCAFANNVQGNCGGSGPDVVYAYTPTQNVTVTISLCDPATDFDTELDLYQNSSATLVACADDVCGLQSEISNVTLFAGNTYYIVVDGFAGACGNYRLNITDSQVACNVGCPLGATPEGEPVYLDGATDNYDAGCNSSPPSWVDVPCSMSPVTICGQYGTFVTGGVNYRDTDWYRIVANQPMTLFATLNGEINSVLAILDITGGCNNPQAPGGIMNVLPCATTTCTATVPAGVYYVFVAPANFTGSPGAQRYTLTVSGTNCVTGIKPRSWSSVKALYR